MVSSHSHSSRFLVGNGEPMEETTMNTDRKPAFAATLLAICMVLSSFPSFAQSDKGDVHYSKPAIDLRLTMRRLWEDHMTWTRNYIVSALGDLGDTDKAAERLLKNQEDIGQAIKPYYGEQAGNRLTALLKEHITLATEVVGAAKAGNNANLEQAQRKWRANAGDIATFLSGANPNWSKASLTDMLNKHLEFLTGEVSSRLKKDWTADVAYADKNHDHMLIFADTLTEGIVKQFPENFRKK